MGLVGRLRRGWGASAAVLEAERRVVRFQRVVEQHGEILDVLADLEDKESGEYILDRQYVEAQADRVFEGARRLLYDAQVLTGGLEEDGYEALERLRQLAETTLIERERRGVAGAGPGDGVRDEETDWELVALREVRRQLAGAGDGAGSGQQACLAQVVAGAHLAAAWRLAGSLRGAAREAVRTDLPRGGNASCLEVFAMGGLRRRRAWLARRVAGGATDHERTVDLLPLEYFLEGLEGAGRGTSNGGAEAPAREEGARGGGCPALYVGEGLLLLHLPPDSPFRLLLCCLSVQDRENLLYAFGTGPQAPGAGDAHRTETVRAPFPCYSVGSPSGAWTTWACGFNWAQGEERLRLLGDWVRRAGRGGDGQVSREGAQRFLERMLRIGVADAPQAALPRSRGVVA